MGLLSVDLLLCDPGSRVLVVNDIRAPQATERSRHERMSRVLRAAGIQVHTWRKGDLPALAEVRMAMSHLAGAAAAATPGAHFSTSRPIPLFPVAESAEISDISAVLAAGDRAAFEAADAAMEPVPSAFLDEFAKAQQWR